MTKEELEKEIKNYIDKNCKQWETDGLTVDDIVRIAVLDFAEPREKRISGLEGNVAYYAERAKHAELAGRDYVLENKDLGKRCLQLQKDKGNLTDRISDLEDKLANADYQLEGRDNEIRELEAQIEKMKCCGNCTNGNCVNIGQIGKACDYWTSNVLRR